jgi:hypothetical protein
MLLLATLIVFGMGSIAGQNSTNTTLPTGGLNLTNLTDIGNISDSSALQVNELVINSS